MSSWPAPTYAGSFVSCPLISMLFLRSPWYFRLRSGASGLEVVEFWGPTGPLPQNKLEEVGGEAPPFFQCVLRWEGAG